MKFNPDYINGAFEVFGAYFTWMNAWKLYKDKTIKGVYWLTTGFFALWGVWNLYYYRAIEQWFSWYGGMILVVGNLLWFGQAIYFWRKRVTAPKYLFDDSCVECEEAKGVGAVCRTHGDPWDGAYAN